MEITSETMILSLCMTVYWEFKWLQRTRLVAFVGYHTAPELVRRLFKVNRTVTKLLDTLFVVKQWVPNDVLPLCIRWKRENTFYTSWEQIMLCSRSFCQHEWVYKLYRLSKLQSLTSYWKSARQISCWLCVWRQKYATVWLGSIWALCGN